VNWDTFFYRSKHVILVTLTSFVLAQTTPFSLLPLAYATNKSIPGSEASAQTKPVFAQPPPTASLNQPPVTTDDYVMVTSGSSVTIRPSELISNDSDNDGRVRFVEFSRSPADISKGSITSDNWGKLTRLGNPSATNYAEAPVMYTPPEGLGGIIRFEYTVEDRYGNSSKGSVHVTVQSGEPTSAPPQVMSVELSPITTVPSWTYGGVIATGTSLTPTLRSVVNSVLAAYENVTLAQSSPTVPPDFEALSPTVAMEAPAVTNVPVLEDTSLEMVVVKEPQEQEEEVAPEKSATPVQPSVVEPEQVVEELKPPTPTPVVEVEQVVEEVVVEEITRPTPAPLFEPEQVEEDVVLEDIPTPPQNPLAELDLYRDALADVFNANPDDIAQMKQIVRQHLNIYHEFDIFIHAEKSGEAIFSGNRLIVSVKTKSGEQLAAVDVNLNGQTAFMGMDPVGLKDRTERDEVSPSDVGFFINRKTDVGSVLSTDPY
jgi:hypothetical protein